ncbi:MAG: hypothetical protein B6A08_08530 [Sorangiineae bacterium NIC37A_2]|nr:MAG: hypothetical protein B6A08_08530 [Sorangiineae bacterium NIC37A_2]
MAPVHHFQQSPTEPSPELDASTFLTGNCRAPRAPRPPRALIFPPCHRALPRALRATARSAPPRAHRSAFSPALRARALIAQPSPRRSAPARSSLNLPPARSAPPRAHRSTFSRPLRAPRGLRTNSFLRPFPRSSSLPAPARAPGALFRPPLPGDAL